MDSYEKTGADVTNRILYWNPGEPNSVCLSPYPDPNYTANKRYQSCSLACYTNMREATFEERKLYAFITAMHLIVRDGMNPQKVHEVFFELDEYKDGCAEDMPFMLTE